MTTFRKRLRDKIPIMTRSRELATPHYVQDQNRMRTRCLRIETREKPRTSGVLLGASDSQQEAWLRRLHFKQGNRSRKSPSEPARRHMPRTAASGFEPGASAFRGGALNRCEVRTRRAKTVGYFNPEEYQKNHIHVHPSYRTKCCLTETQSKAQIEIRRQANHYRVRTPYGSISSAWKSATFSPKHHPDLFPKFASDRFDLF